MSTVKCHLSATNTVRSRVWPIPASLVATKGISIDLFSTGTEIFQFPALPLPCLYIQQGVIPYNRDGVTSFGDLRVKACEQLAEAYRSFPRPSSELSAKASVMCTFLIYFLFFVYSVFYPAASAGRINVQLVSLLIADIHALQHMYILPIFQRSTVSQV